MIENDVILLDGNQTIEIPGNPKVYTSGNPTVIVTGAKGEQGIQGIPGEPATQRKLSIWRVRQNNNTFECESEELFNNTGYVVDLQAIYNSNITIYTSLIESRPFNVIWNGGILGNNEQPYIFSSGVYVLPLPSYIFSDFMSGISDWSYVIIEDLSIYLP